MVCIGRLSFGRSLPMPPKIGASPHLPTDVQNRFNKLNPCLVCTLHQIRIALAWFCGGFATPDADPFLPWIFVVVGREGSASGVRCGSVLQRCRGGAESAGEIRDSGSDPIVRVTARVRSRLRSARVTLDLGADLKLHLTLVNVDWREWIRTSLTLFRPGHCQVGCHFRSSSWVLLWMGGPGGKD